MKLIFIHGPAAVGKLTVGRVLATLTGLPLFHNHLIVDAVSAVFPFGSPAFVQMRHELWMAMFREAVAQDISLIFTFTPERTVPFDFVEQVTDLVGDVIFVKLECPVEEQERRLGNESRAEFKKLRSVEILRKGRAEGASTFPPLPDSGLTLDTGKLSPLEAAREIQEFIAR